MRQTTPQIQDEARGPMSRRKLFAGATGIGAVAVAASLLPGSVTQSNSVAPAKAAPLKGGGYTLSEHVKQYYKSALI
jgi:hypothetical protein